MERKPHGTNRVSKTRRIPHRTTKKLEKSYKINGGSIRKYKETIWQEEKELSRVESWRWYMVGS